MADGDYTRICTSENVRPGLTPYAAGEDEQPFTCPVCGGNGIRPAGFYSAIAVNGFLTWSASSTAATEPCRSCDGTGIVWRY